MKCINLIIAILVSLNVIGYASYLRITEGSAGFLSTLGAIVAMFIIGVSVTEFGRMTRRSR